MAEPVQFAQPTVLDIPVTVQGSKTVEGTDQRELFKETTKATIVFENGVALKLNAKVQPGQCLFLRNERSGREILCKVRESQQAGEAGYTDLEFTARDPEFWAVPADQPQTANQAPETQNAIESAGPPIAAPTLEPRALASEEIPAGIPRTALMSPSDPAPETRATLPEPDWDDAKDAELAAALSAMESSSKASREPVPEVTKKTVQGVASETAPTPQEKSTESASKPAVVPPLPSVISRIRQSIEVKNPIAIGMAATVLIAAVLGIAWHAKGGASTSRSDRAFAGSDQSAPQPLPAAAQSPPAPDSWAAALATNTGARPGVAVVQSAKATAADVGDARESNASAGPTALAIPSMGASGRLVRPAHAALGQAMHRKPDKNDAEIIPAKIVWQSPAAIPPWAKDLEMDGTVTLDVLIDENGNVREAKPLSGPHPLWSAAERAVMLWIFEPGLSDGKPTATHMVLTVEFQK